MGFKHGIFGYTQQRGLGLKEKATADKKLPALVVDGNSVAYYLAKHAKMDARLDGDAALFLAEARRFLAALMAHSAGMTVLFDGPTPVEKLAESAGHAAQRITLIESATRHIREHPRGLLDADAYSGFVMRVANSAMRGLLVELGVPFQVCLGNADAQIAETARAQNAYVISRNTNFFIFDVPGYVAGAPEGTTSLPPPSPANVLLLQLSSAGRG